MSIYLTSLKKYDLPFKVMILAIFIVFGLFAWQGNTSFDLNDEGFLWYGVQRVLLGEIPIRDFQAYDPGRYYWSAILMQLFGDNGIISLRLALAGFQILGMFVGLLVIARTTGRLEFSNLIYLVISSFILVVWMFPRHKLIDLSLPILLIGVLAFLIQKPIPVRYFFAGFCIGMVAVFGRNHGIYGAIACLGVMVWIRLNKSDGLVFLTGFWLWLSGVLVGFSPVILMSLLIPDFFHAFLETILFLFEVKATSLPLPIPWPWRVEFGGLLSDVIRGVLVGLFFIALLGYSLLTIAFVVRQRLKGKELYPAFVASAFLSLPYAHYAFARGSVGHLAHGIAPLLIGCLILLMTKPALIKWPFALFLLFSSLWVAHVYHPGWECYKNNNCVNVEISNNVINVNPTIAGAIGYIRELDNKYTPNGESFISAPFWPGVYSLLERKSPMWEIYALFPRPASFQEAEIERIKYARPQFVFVLDVPLDGRDDLRFKNSHPLIYQYFSENFELIKDSPEPFYKIFKVKTVLN